MTQCNQSIFPQIKVIEDFLEHLNSRSNKLDESIKELEGLLHNTKGKNHSTNLQGEDINDLISQIIRHGKSAAAVIRVLKPQKYPQGVVGVVADLGKVKCANLSQVLSDYLGDRSMLAVVCQNYVNVNNLEGFDYNGNINKNVGIHRLASANDRTVEGRFDVIFLEKLKPYIGPLIADDPQRRLDLLKPKLPTGEIRPGFVDFAVNMIQIDPEYLLPSASLGYSLTSLGYGLRETLFYNLFSHLQVYRRRVDMFNAISSITEGAISLDGGIIRSAGIFTLGSSDEGNVRFAMINHSDIENQLKELNMCKHDLLRHIEQVQSDLEEKRKECKKSLIDHLS